MIYALAGNQNSGKTTLFNQLTGSNQHVGNFPGVTVDSKMGEIRGEKGNAVVDLPGIYSIRPYTNEEIVTRSFILQEKPDGIINIVDATNIERNLYLTLQLLELHIPMVIALNMMDEVRGNGGTIDIGKMEEALGVPVVAISAAKNEGIEDLIRAVREVASRRIYPKVTDFCEKGPVHRCIHAVSHQVEDHAERIGMSPRFAATKIVEGDAEIIDRLALSSNELDLMEHSIVEMEQDSGMDRNAALAAMRYDFIERICSRAVMKCRESREHIRSMKIDSVLTHKYLAVPAFMLIMLVVFYLTFGLIGSFFSDLLSLGIDALSGMTERALVNYGINPVVESLVIDGIFTGVGSVLSFLDKAEPAEHLCSQIGKRLVALLVVRVVIVDGHRQITVAADQHDQVVKRSQIIQARLDRMRCVQLSPVIPHDAVTERFCPLHIAVHLLLCRVDQRQIPCQFHRNVPA